MNDPAKIMLGADQKQWLKDSLSASTADWRCIASSVLMADLTLGGGVVGYTVPWQGYRAERSELLSYIASNEMDNVVVLSGDWHRSIVANLRVDFSNISSPAVASEFCGMALTSDGDGDHGGVATHIGRVLYYPLNLHMRFYESELHGYVVCDVTKTTWTTTYRTVDRANPSAAAQTLAVFEVTNGTPGVTMTAGSGGNPFAPGL